MMAFCRRLALTGMLALAAVPSTAHATSTCSVPGFTNAAFGFTGVSVGNGKTDSYTEPTYTAPTGTCPACSPASACSGGVSTNTQNGISLGPNACVDGQCQDGYGGSTGNISGSGNCNSTGVEPSTQTAYPVVDPGYSTGTNVSSGTIAPGYEYTNISVAGTNTLTFQPGIYVIDSFSTSGGATIAVSPSSSTYVAADQVTIIIKNDIQLTGSGDINGSGSPGNFLILCMNSVTGNVKVAGNANTHYAVYCPKANVTIDGNGAVFGAVVGNNVTFNGNNEAVHYDTTLGSITTGSINCTPAEIARSAPVLAQINNTTALMQGTFTYINSSQSKLANTNTSTAAWTFPYIQGHMRARDATLVTSTASSFATGATLLDMSTAGSIPTRLDSCAPPLNGTCRYVFTNVNSTPATSGTTTFTRPSASPWTQSDTNIKAFNDSNASTIGNLIAPSATYTTYNANDYKTISHKIIDGVLGGVDRSTVAVIQPSLFTTSGSRPTMAYFGGTDGMLHAVCASTGGTTRSQSGTVCPALGRELWAFVPRVELPLFASNDQRIDGSVHVIDAFGDFVTTTGTGTKSWKTILVFQTGGQGASSNFAKPGAYAIDVTDPASPILLWEYTTPGNATSLDFGFGLWSAAGVTLVNGAATNLAVFETNNGLSNPTTTNNPGVVAVAVYLESGVRAWKAATSTLYSVTSVPWAAIPGGAVGADLTGNGYFTHFLYGDLLGQLWSVNAADGTSATASATTPLFKFTYTANTIVRPIGGVPAIYSDGSLQYAAVASGGYADQYDDITTWSAGTQLLAAVKIKASSTPVLDTASACNTASCDLRLLPSLDAGTKSYSQPTIVGNQMFATSDAVDVNTTTYGTTASASGHVLTVNGINGSATTTTYGTSSVYGGASSLAAGSVSGTTVIFSGSSDKNQKVGTAGISAAGTGIATSTGALGAGTSVGVGQTTKLTRSLWLRTM